MVLRSCKVKGPVQSLNVRSTGVGQCSQLSDANVLIFSHNFSENCKSLKMQGCGCSKIRDIKEFIMEILTANRF